MHVSFLLKPINQPFTANHTEIKVLLTYIIHAGTQSMMVTVLFAEINYSLLMCNDTY